MTAAGTAAWLRPRLWMGTVVGSVVWLVWIGSLAVGGWYRDANGTLVGADHLAFYSAAHLIRDGQPARMYDHTFLPNYQDSLIGWNWHGFEAYRNPPFYALLYLPTTGLSYYASFLLWTAIGFGLLLFSLRLLGAEHPLRAFRWSLTFYPIFATATFGQNTFLSLAVFAGVYRLLERRQPFAAGLLAGLLWFKPQLLLGLFVWWAFTPRRYLYCWLGVGVTALSLAGVSWGFLPEASQAFVDSLRANVGFGGFGMWNVHNPKTFFALLFPGLPAIYWPLTLAAWGVGVWVAWRVSRMPGAPVAVMFPVAVFLTLWVSPHALIYEWALLVAPAVVLWERFTASRDIWVCLFGLAWCGLAVSTPVTLVQLQHLPVAVQLSIPLLAVVGWLAARELRSAWSLDGQP